MLSPKPAYTFVYGRIEPILNASRGETAGAGAAHASNSGATERAPAPTAMVLKNSRRVMRTFDIISSFRSGDRRACSIERLGGNSRRTWVIDPQPRRKVGRRIITPSRMRLLQQPIVSASISESELDCQHSFGEFCMRGFLLYNLRRQRI